MANKKGFFLKKYEVYQVSRIVLLSTKRWLLDVLTLLINSFGSKYNLRLNKKCVLLDLLTIIEIVEVPCYTLFYGAKIEIPD